MAKRMLDDFDGLPARGDLIDQVAHRHERLSVMKKETAELKTRTDFKGLLTWLGLEVKKNGRGWMLLCPFHADTTPSCSVDFKKGRFHCFGCGTKGDIIEFVKLYRHTDFKGALEVLKEYSGLTGRKKPAVLKKKETEPLQTDITFKDIADYYHKKLFENKKALAYLKKRGFTDPELYARFKIGYVDGSLPQVLSENQKKALIQMNILNDRGTERFYKRIVFPMYDENNKIINFYGRSITDNNTPHLFLPEVSRGLFNPNAPKVYPELTILTESVLDSLSVIQAGIDYTMPCYGTNGFSKLLLKTLKNANVRTVCIAFDSDPAGHEGSDKLKAALLTEGFAVKQVYPEGHKDWNGWLTAGGMTKEAVLSLIEGAETSKPEADEEEELTYLNKEGEHCFTIDNLTYRLKGVKKDFTSSLITTVIVESGEEQVIDKGELYSHKVRLRIAEQIHCKFGLSIEEVEARFLKIIKRLNKEKQQEQDNRTEKKVDLTKEQRKAAEKFLNNPDLVKELLRDLTIMGLVGEEMNKLLLYLIMTSRKIADPLSAYILGRSSGGKSWLVKRAALLMPPGSGIMVNSSSDQAMYYTGRDLIGKLVILGEFSGAENIERELRQILSDGKISRMVTMKDPVSGAMKTGYVEAYGPISFISTTTNSDVNPENLSRCLILYPDETPQQSKRIKKYQDKLRGSKEGYILKSKIEEVMKKHHAVQQMLDDIVIFNPFVDEIEFPTIILKGRRVYINFLTVIDMVAYVYQKQREVKQFEFKGKQISYIECTIADYRIAFDIMMSGILENMLDSMPKSARDFHEILKAKVCEKAKAGKKDLKNIHITIRDMLEFTGWSPKQVRSSREKLFEYGCLERVSGFSRGEKHKYRVLPQSDFIKKLLKQIPTPEEIEKRISLSDFLIKGKEKKR